MDQKTKEAAYRRLAEARPDPKCELVFASPFELLVSTVLAAQSTDKGVNAATAVLYKAANTPEAILALGEEGLIPYISSIGLYKSKAKHVIGLCRALIERFGGAVPEDFNALCTLPGVGHKTANVVLNVAFRQPTVPVDTHVFRIANRTGLAPGRTPDDVSEAIVKTCPPDLLLDIHHQILLHGRYCCKAKAPMCWECPMADLCEFGEKTEKPAPKKRRQISPRLEAAAKGKKKAKAV